MLSGQFRPANSERSATCRQGGSGADGTSVSTVGTRLARGTLLRRLRADYCARNLVWDSSPGDGLRGVSDHRAGRGLGSTSGQNRWSLTPRYPLGRRQRGGLRQSARHIAPRVWRPGNSLHDSALVVTVIAPALSRASNSAMAATSRERGTPPAEGVFPPCVPLPVPLPVRLADRT